MVGTCVWRVLCLWDVNVSQMRDLDILGCWGVYLGMKQFSCSKEEVFNWHHKSVVEPALGTKGFTLKKLSLFVNLFAFFYHKITTKPNLTGLNRERRIYSTPHVKQHQSQSGVSRFGC